MPHHASQRPAGLDRRTVLVALGAAAAAHRLQAQETYPARTLKIITFFPPGGIADSSARLVADGLTRKLGQPVIVDSRPGAGSLIAAKAALAAPADGYTIMFVGASSSIASLLYPNPGFSYLKDFVPLGMIGGAAHVLVVRPGFPARTVREFIAYAKANPGKVNYASVGNGTSTHIEMEMLKSKAGIDLAHIPYKGSGPALTAILSGDVDVMFDGVGSSMPHIRAGKLVPLAISAGRPSPSAPGIAPLSSEGVPGFDILAWSGLMLRAGTPSAVADKLNEALNAVLEEPETQAKFREQGFDLIPGSRDKFGQFLAQDLDKWGTAIRSANIKME